MTPRSGTRLTDAAAAVVAAGLVGAGSFAGSVVAAGLFAGSVVAAGVFAAHNAANKTARPHVCV
jgi:hypothetical protein